MESIFASHLYCFVFPLSTLLDLGEHGLSGMIFVSCCFKCRWEAWFFALVDFGMVAPSHHPVSVATAS
jgi:hypothetical protein